MSITITDKALNEIRSRAEKQKIKHIALYLDVAQQCCCISAFAKVIEQPNAAPETIKNVADMPIYACNLIKQILSQDDIRAKIDLVRRDELTIRFHGKI